MFNAVGRQTLPDHLFSGKAIQQFRFDAVSKLDGSLLSTYLHDPASTG